jgi:3-deoxy-D-manno-octulosonic-acid transferase
MNRTLYTLLLYLVLPFTPLKLLWRGRKQKEYLAHWQERYGFYRQRFQQPVIWLHCVSVGETRAAEPLVKALIAQYPQRQILLTHTTPTGRATSQQLFSQQRFGERVKSAYLPYDVPCGVRRFLKHFKPDIGIIMETELWFNLIAACKQREVPLLLVNARLSEKSAQGYAKLGKLVQQGLQSLTAIAAQTLEDAARLQQLAGQDVPVQVTGNLKFDVTPPEHAAAIGQQLRNIVAGKRPVFLAASTRDGEERLILEAIKLANMPDLLTIIVPRHPQRFDEVAELLTANSLSFVRRSAFLKESLEKRENEAEQNTNGKAIVQPNVAVVLGDSMGEMFAYYAACDIAFIGGSLLPLGGQNLIEAFSMGKPVLIGPHTFNFAQITGMAIQVGAALRVQSPEALAQQLQQLFANSPQRQSMAATALAFCAQNQGATQRTLALLAPHIKN